MGRLKTVHQTQYASSLELKFFLRVPPGPLLGPLRTPEPRLQLPSGIQDLPHAVKSRRPDQTPSTAKKQDYFKGVFFRIIYCIVFLDFS